MEQTLPNEKEFQQDLELYKRESILKARRLKLNVLMAQAFTLPLEVNDAIEENSKNSTPEA